MSPNDKNLVYNSPKRKNSTEDVEFGNKKAKISDALTDDTCDNIPSNDSSQTVEDTIHQIHTSKDESDDDIELIETNESITPPPETQDALTKGCYVSLRKLRIPPNIEPDPATCEECGQLIKDVVNYSPNPDSSTFVSSTGPSISPYTRAFSSSDLSILDRAGHLVPYDAGLLEQGRQLYLSGVVTVEAKAGHTTLDKVGPISSWYRTPWLVSESNPRLVSRKLVLIIGLAGEDLECEVSSPLHLSVEYRRAVAKYHPIVRLDKLDSRSDDSRKHFTSCDMNTPSIMKQLENGSEPFTPVSKLLESLGGFAGMGKALRHLLPDCPESSDSVAAFLLFVNERQQIWRRKQRGDKILTKNKVMSEKWFTNMYRELDRGTIFFRNMIISSFPDGISSYTSHINEDMIKRILFQSLAYRLVNKMETFMAFGKLPDPEDWVKFGKFLRARFRKNEKIFTAAHQNMGLEKYLKTIAFVAKESNMNALTKKLRIAAEKRNLKDCNDVLLSIENVGPFFAWQVLCDLLECNLLGKCTDNQWTSLGPGAKSGLRRIFNFDTKLPELRFTRLLRNLCAVEGESSGFEAMGIEFPAFLDKELSLKNVEHALCEFDKYYRFTLGMAARERSFSKATSRVHLDKIAKCSLCKGKTENGKGNACVLCKRHFHFECHPKNISYPEIDEFWLCERCNETANHWKQQDTDFQEIYLEKNYKKLKPKKEIKPKKEVKETQIKTATIEVVNLSDDENYENDVIEEYGEESDDNIEILYFGKNPTLLEDESDVYDLDSFLDSKEQYSENTEP